MRRKRIGGWQMDSTHLAEGVDVEITYKRLHWAFFSSFPSNLPRAHIPGMIPLPFQLAPAPLRHRRASVEASIAQRGFHASLAVAGRTL